MQLDVLYAVKDQVLLFARTHSDMTVHIVFGLGVAESIALISFFIPSTILFLAIGGLHQAAGGEFLPIWMAGAAGAFIGDILSYAVGRHFDSHIAAVWPFNRRPHWIENARAFTRRWGVTSVVAGKFLGMLRPLVPVAAGVTHMPAWQFVAASLISALLWAGIFLSPGYGIALLGH